MPVISPILPDIKKHISLYANSTVSAYLAAFIGIVIFSSNAIYIKLAYRFEVDALSLLLLLLRLLLALPMYIIAAVVSFRKNPTKPSLKDWLFIFLFGVTGYYLAGYLNFLGLKHISAGPERLVLQQNIGGLIVIAGVNPVNPKSNSQH